jgi:peptide/nickel transport system substrate-binding protein
MFQRRRKVGVAGVAALAATALLAAGCGASGSSSPSSSGGTKETGGTATVAWPPGAQANWIWPYAPITNYSVYNSQNFQWMMYRPLYMFGDNGSSVSVNYTLSPADAPVYSGTSVTINLKGWKWSNGETVDAKDVIFWLNMEEAEKANYAGYAPGTLPDNLTSYSATGPEQVTLHLNQTYSSYWYTYNQLAEITPMPMAWDVSSLGATAGSGGCTTDTAADGWAKCQAVWTFLTAQAKDTSTYASSPIWGVVDGPWKLQSFTAAGNDTLVPNASFSGSPKPTLSAVNWVPYTDDSTEYTALKTGKIDVGYVPWQDLPVKPANANLPATSPLGSAYTLAAYFPFGIYYYQENFNGPLGAVFKQLYVRQALQYVDDQVGMDKAIYRGYSFPTSGPVPNTPPNQYTPTAQSENDYQGVYPFNIAKAKSLLTSHGWTEQGGIMTCTDASKCGAGIAAGTKFQFTLDYASGQVTFQEEAATYKSDASQAGIGVNIVSQSFNTVIGESTPCSPGPSCSWDALMYGGWLFNGPGFEPTGEPLFETGAGSNSGSYSDAAMDKLINESHTNSALSVMQQYATYGAQQLPYVFMPNPYTVQAVASNLHNVTFNSLGTFLPEYWYFTK